MWEPPDTVEDPDRWLRYAVVAAAVTTAVIMEAVAIWTLSAVLPILPFLSVLPER